MFWRIINFRRDFLSVLFMRFPWRFSRHFLMSKGEKEIWNLFESLTVDNEKENSYWCQVLYFIYCLAHFLCSYMPWCVGHWIVLYRFSDAPEKVTHLRSVSTRNPILFWSFWSWSSTDIVEADCRWKIILSNFQQYVKGPKPTSVASRNWHQVNKVPFDYPISTICVSGTHSEIKVLEDAFKGCIQ